MATLKKTLLGLKSMFIRPTVRESAAAICTLFYLIFQSWRTFIYPLPPMLLRPICIASVVLLCTLYKPFNTKNASKPKKIFIAAFDIFCFLTAVAALVYHTTSYGRLLRRINYLDPVFTYEKVLLFALIIGITGAILRTVGKPLVIFILVFLAYAWVSPYLPGVLYYRGADLDKLTSLLLLGNEGIYGSAAAAAAGFLFWMMVFGGLFSGGSGGQCLIDIGLRAGAKSKDNSAPAKAAVLSSCLFGMISGSASANVASTGVFTIPLMKKVGYSPEEAGAIEAVASTGGQIMPPIMGAAAFLMADMLEINYLEIASAALVPGLIYYSAVFLLVHLLAKKRSRTGTYTPIKIESEPILPRLYMLLPVAVLVGALASGYTIQRSALYGILSCILIGIISPKKYRLSIIEIFNMVVEATRRAATVAAPLAGCGIIIGIISMTGLASRMSVVISSLGSGFIWVGLLISMIGCMLLGMALPTLAAYLTAYVLFIPTLRNLGIGILPANLFIFYFGIFAHITPPVCIASYTAAGIAGAKSWDTGWKAFTFALCAFFAPFVFVYQPGILLMGTFWEIVTAIFTLAFGTMMLTFGLAGYVIKHLTRLERALSILSGILIVIPESFTDKVGFGLAIALIIWQFIQYTRLKRQSKDAFAV